MSNSNNIYNILNKIASLTPAPTQETAKQQAQAIYESVEAKGSILEGVAKIEQRLKEQLAKEGTDEKVYRHKGTYGNEYQGDSDDEEETQRQADKGTRKRGRPAKAGKKPVKKNPTGQRGRPKKADSEKSMAHLPWGGKPPKVDLNPTKKWPKDKTTVHKMEGVSKLGQRMLGESCMIDESGETLKHILNRFKTEVKKFQQGGDLDHDLYYALYDYYSDQGEMPYGTAKGRDGDPYEWVSLRLDQDLQQGQMSLPTMQDEAIDPTNPRDYEVPAVQRKAAGQEPLSMDDVKAKDEKHARDYRQRAGLEEELNELAKLAGLQTEATDKKAFAALAEPKDKITYADKIAGANKDKDVEEGNEFSGALAKAKAAGAKDFEVDGKKYKVEESCGDMSPFTGAGDMDSDNLNINTSYNSKDGRKSITVTADGEMAEQLAQMLKLSGLGGGHAEQQQPEVKVISLGSAEEVEEERDIEHANTPDEQVATVDAVTDQGDDLNRQKKQFAGKPKMGDNPMAEEINPVEQMGRKLMQAYESIKLQK